MTTEAEEIAAAITPARLQALSVLVHHSRARYSNRTSDPTESPAHVWSDRSAQIYWATADWLIINKLAERGEAGWVTPTQFGYQVARERDVRASDVL